ncbi:hypothetical protein DYB32_008065 [Aphanomyces invadans]|uniref:Uncharacterized protein n=1 Tax=Aphanomyces invadans TaxID=157072 RepID=A0A3R7CYS7_9STRA|nr:hypothetical protein DYB32_008065 [Aphanomyces invadans]
MSAASRGSRVHHVRKTPNPFFTTSSGIVGINLHEPTEFLAPKLDDHTLARPTDNNQSEEAKLVKFMYQTTTSSIGEGIERRESPMTQRMDKFAVKRGKTALTRVVGEEKGAIQVTTERIVKPGTFTNSFNGFRYRDYGLNTAVTKSKICDALDHS